MPMIQPKLPHLWDTPPQQRNKMGKEHRKRHIPVNNVNIVCNDKTNNNSNKSNNSFNTF